MNLKSLKEKRNELVSKMKSMQMGAEVEKRTLTTDENMLFDLLEKEVRSLDVQIQGSSNGIQWAKGENMNNKELRTAENQFNGELRALNGTGMASAGVTVPTILSADIVKGMTEISDVINDCAKVKVKGKYKQIKRKSSNTVGWTSEFADIMKSKAEYEGIEIDNYKISGLDVVSLEIWNESQFNILNEVKENFKEDLSVKIENAIFNGTGAEQPTGLLNGAELTAVELNADLLIDMITALKKKYNNGAKFYLSRPTLAKVRKLKDNEGRYIFDSTSNKILGYDYSITESLTDEIIFGNFKLGYKLNISPNMMVQVLTEKFIDIGAYGVVINAFLDGKVIDADAFAINKISA